MSRQLRDTQLLDRIYAVARQIPAGKVATYGQIAGIVAGCTARMVGHAMASLPEGLGVPWQRVINAQGTISPRGNQLSSHMQRVLLSEEGVTFMRTGKVDWKQVRWSGPPIHWLIENGFDPEPKWKEE